MSPRRNPKEILQNLKEALKNPTGNPFQKQGWRMGGYPNIYIYIDKSNSKLKDLLRRFLKKVF